MQELLLGDSLFILRAYRKLIKRPIPHTVLNKAVQSLFGSKVYVTLGAKYLYAYLKLTGYRTGEDITEHDFLIFSITLRKELAVTMKTIKRYLTVA